MFHSLCPPALLAGADILPALVCHPLSILFLARLAVAFARVLDWRQRCKVAAGARFGRVRPYKRKPSPLSLSRLTRRPARGTVPGLRAVESGVAMVRDGA